MPVTKNFGPHGLNGRRMILIHIVRGDRYNIRQRTAHGSKHRGNIGVGLPRLFAHITRADDVSVRIPTDLSGQVNDLALGLHDAHAEPAAVGLPNTGWIEADYAGHIEPRFRVSAATAGVGASAAIPSPLHKVGRVYDADISYEAISCRST